MRTFEFYFVYNLLKLINLIILMSRTPNKLSHKQFYGDNNNNNNYYKKSKIKNEPKQKITRIKSEILENDNILRTNIIDINKEFEEFTRKEEKVKEIKENKGKIKERIKENIKNKDKNLITKINETNTNYIDDMINSKMNWSTKELYNNLQINENNFIYNENNILKEIQNDKELENFKNKINIIKNNEQNDNNQIESDILNKNYNNNSINNNRSNDINPNEINLNLVNQIREGKNLKYIKHIYCFKCLAIDKHSTSNCPMNICNICLKSGHISKNCLLKPILCQYCGKDINPNNVTRPHSNNFDCPNRKNFFFRKRCLICRKYGHIAKDCWFKYN